MVDRPLRERIADQFSDRGDRADLWRAFEYVLDTGAFLNLGHSARYQPHVLGSPQRRLVTEVGSRVAAALPTTECVRLLDLGCGRGGPAIHLADRLGARVTGLDLVPHNVERARANARAAASGTDPRPAASGTDSRPVASGTTAGRATGGETQFLVGDATQLPLAVDSVAACTAIDSLVYVPDRTAVVAGMADVLEPGGVLVCSDLVRREGTSAAERRRVDAFADAWDMPSPGTVAQYRDALTGSGLEPATVEDISAHSVGRFRRWTKPFLGLVDGRLGPLVEHLLRRGGLDPTTVVDQVRRAHEALPSLRHVLVVARAPAR